MKRTLFLSLLLFIFTSCIHTSDLIDERLSAQIPSNADRVIIQTPLSDDELFETISSSLVREGHRIERDRELMSINTDGHYIGQSTFARYNLFIEDGSVTGRTTWMRGGQASAMNSENWEPAVWATGRPARAYASLVNLMLQFEHRTFHFK